MLIVSAILALLLAVGQDDARILSTGNLDARHEALARIIAIAPAERTADLWRALRQEVDRVVACLDVVPPSPAAWQTLHCEITPTPRSEENYLADLVMALGQSRDPSVIPTLIKVAPSGAMATTGLARFGDLAVPALIASALSSRSGPWVTEASGAMFTLARMLERPAAARRGSASQGVL